MSILDEIFGQKPQVAKYKQQPLGEAQLQSLLGNIGSFGDISQLGELFTKYMTGQENELLPGYSDTLASGEKATQDLLSQGDKLLTGELPQDVIDAVKRNSAFESLQGGFAGSGMSRSLTARDLGLTSLDLMTRGADMIGRGGNSAQIWSSLARGNILDPMTMLTTPGQQEAANVQNAVLKQQSQQMGFNVAAAADPAASGIFNTLMGGLGAAAGAWNYGNMGNASLASPSGGQQSGGGGGGGL